MRVTKIDKPVAVFRKALGYDPQIPDGDVEEPEFEGAFVLIPRDNSGIEFVPAPTVTDGNLATYAETDAHDEAMRITLDFASRFIRVEVLGAWETSTERTYTLEGANLPDFSDAVELDSQTFTPPADWDPYEIVFEYESLPTAYQYYRLIGPDEVRRWHNLRLIPASVDGCECIELCRDHEPPALVASNDSPDLAQSDPIDLGAIPSIGNLWMAWTTAGAGDMDGWIEDAGPMAAGGTIQTSMFSREVQSGDNGEHVVGAGTHWLTAEFSGVATTASVVEELDDQSTGGGGGTCQVSITLPAGEWLVVGYVNHDNTLEPTAESGWTLAETQSYATTKYHTLVYAFVSGGGAVTPGVVVSAAGSWFGFAAAYAVADVGVVIDGGPDGTFGVAACAAPGDHAHAYTAEQIAVTPFGSIAADNVQDALEEIIAEASSGAPTNADYLVGTANGSLSNEIVVGTTPGGELGGTWASPTVDATHSGSTHSAATDAHIADATDAHDASAISIVDAGGFYTSTDVEGALQEAAEMGGDPSEDTHVWMPLTTVVGGEPELVWDADDSLIPTLVPI